MPLSYDPLDAFSDVLASLYATPTPAQAAGEWTRPLQRLFVGRQVDVVWTPDQPAGNAIPPVTASFKGCGDGTPGSWEEAREQRPETWVHLAKAHQPGETVIYRDSGAPEDGGRGLVLAARLDGGVLGIRLPPGGDSGQDAAAWLERLRPHVAAALAGVRSPGESLPESDLVSGGDIDLGSDGRAGDALPAGLAWMLAKHFRWRQNDPGHPASGLPDALDQWVRERVLSQPALAAGGHDAAAVHLHTFTGPAGGLSVRLTRDAQGDGFQLRVREDPRGVDWYRLAALGLTERECEVLHGIAQGQRDAEIAGGWGVAVKTIGKHVERILKKLGADSRLGAAYSAQVWLNHGVAASRREHAASS